MKINLNKYASIILALSLCYLFVGFVMREMGKTRTTRMGKYPINVNNTIITGSAEETKEVIDALMDEPTIIEIIFNPADILFNWIGL